MIEMLKKEEILQLISDDSTSERKRLARQGQKYYDGEHDILNYQIYYYDADGQLRLDKFKSNIRISHPFFTELVDQQVQYMLSGEGNIFRSDKPELQTILDEYFDDDFYSEIYELLTGAVSKGFEYLYASTGKDGKTRFGYADSIGVVEVRAKDTDDGCAYYIYWYIDRIDKGTKKIKRIQVWDKEKIYFYVSTGDGKIEEDDSVEMNPRHHSIYTDEKGKKYGKGFGFIPFWRLDNGRKQFSGKIEEDDSVEMNPRHHSIYTDEKGKKYGKGFGFIPFWRLDNGRKQFSGLKPIKALIDDYDLMACSLSNNLQDFTDALYVVSGFQGANLDEMIQNVKAKKHVGVEPGGGVDIKTVDIPYQARVAKLELDEKNIYRFGMGFNSAQTGDGNITNVVIKSRYALLDLKCNKLEIRLKQLFRNILRVVLGEVNRMNGSDYQQKDVYFVFDREVMTNAQDNAQIELTDAQKQQIQINTLLSLNNVLDDETIIQTICEILDIDYESIRDKLPKDDMMQAEQELNAVIPEGGVEIEQDSEDRTTSSS